MAMGFNKCIDGGEEQALGKLYMYLLDLCKTLCAYM